MPPLRKNSGSQTLSYRNEIGIRSGHETYPKCHYSLLKIALTCHFLVLYLVSSFSNNPLPCAEGSPGSHRVTSVEAMPSAENRMGGQRTHELVLLDQAGQALAEAQSFEEIKVIRDKAEAVRKYAQSASLGLDIQNRAAEIKLRAERKAGKLLTQMTLRGGDRRSKIHSERLKLDDLGISRNQSTRWQMEARVPELEFREHLRDTCKAGKEITSARLMRFARQWVDSDSANSKVNGRNVSSKRRSGKAVGNFERKSAGSNSNSISEIVDELANHHQLLDGMLQPLYSASKSTLEAAERRVMRYLLLEIQQLLSRLDKLHRTEAARCTCQIHWDVRRNVV